MLAIPGECQPMLAADEIPSPFRLRPMCAALLPDAMPSDAKLPLATVHIVDDDALMVDALAHSLQHLGCRIRRHHSAEQFLQDYDPQLPQVLVLDLRLPGMGGMELLDRLGQRSELPPTLVLSASAEVSGVVQAMRSGAVDYLEKPPEPQRLHGLIVRLLEQAVPMADERRALKRILQAHQRLTPRERDVFQALARGSSTKQIAHQIGISVRTAHIHRANVMLKLQCESLVELARLAARLDRALQRGSSGS